MVVIADTAPLNYLVLIGAVEVLPRLYDRLLLPDIVLAELQAARTPPVVAAWSRQLPSWITVLPVPAAPPGELSRLDAGERAAILLAREQPPPVLLLIDETDGRRAAAQYQIPTTGTLGILRDAAAQDWLDLPTMFARLRTTNFHSPVMLMETLLAQDLQRKRELA